MSWFLGPGGSVHKIMNIQQYSFSKEVAKRIKEPQSHSSRRIYDQGGPYLGSAVKRARWTSHTLLVQM